MIRLEGWRYLDEELNIPFPWYTSPCLEWLKTIDLKGKKVFEYGAGDSTKWYESKGATVWGVDNSYHWSHYADVSHQTDKEYYLNEINNPCLKNVMFDIICIDGEFRDECLSMAYPRLKKGGYIIIDNWLQPSADLGEWPITQDLLQYLVERIDYYVFKEPKHIDWKTLVIPR